MSPKQVEAKMKKILENYNIQTEITVEKIIDFHYKIEKLPLLKSIYYFMHYAVRAVLKSK